MKVLVVGAGPTGLTAAIELARFGISTRIIDRKSKRSTLSRAVGILPGSLQILSPGGATEKLIQRGIKVSKLNFYNHTKPLANFSLKNGHPEYPHILALAQDETEKILESVFNEMSGQVEYQCGLINLEQTPVGVQVEFNDGHKSTFDYVLGCDGVNSQTRQSLGMDFPGFELNERWSIADVDIDNWIHPYQASIFIVDQGKATLVIPLEAKRYRIVSNTADALAGLPMKCDIQAIRREGQFSLAIRQVDNYYRGRVYLAGDAAHCHTPFGGRGMNLGIADAAEFARRLSDNSLDQYSASRHTAGVSAIKDSEMFRRAMTSFNPLRPYLLKLAGKVVSASSYLQTQMAKNVLGN